MERHQLQNWLQEIKGWLEADAYSTAWVALVPDARNSDQPAWPQALDYLRAHQLEDGGWGEPLIYFAHERTISTLAAIRALDTWQSPNNDDATRIKRALAALRLYSTDLATEPHEPIGFELLLPSLRNALSAFEAELPLDKWATIEALNHKKLALIEHLEPDPLKQYTWWFSMEMLPEERLAQLDDSFLDVNGSLATSTASTAAYLWALRRAGNDSPRAAGYLTRVIEMGEGSVPFAWPAEVFERVWALDAFERAGLDSAAPAIVPVIEGIHASWQLNDPGLSSSDMFRVNDGDDTLVGFSALNWAGLGPSDEAVLAFWDEDHFRTYLDERGASVSVNIHGLSALRSQPGFPHRELAEQLTQWLMTQMKPDVIFDDKWHLSPYYSVAHAIPAFADWNDDIALQCVGFLVKKQRWDGGWGWFESSTLEETAHCVLGMCHAFKQGLLKDDAPLARAAFYFQTNAELGPTERLWIGKTLYRPEGIVKATIFAARTALAQLGYVSWPMPSIEAERLVVTA